MTSLLTKGDMWIVDTPYVGYSLLYKVENYVTNDIRQNCPAKDLGGDYDYGDVI